MSLRELGPSRFAHVAAGNRQRAVDMRLNELNLVDEAGNVIQFGTLVEEQAESSTAPSTISVGNEAILAPLSQRRIPQVKPASTQESCPNISVSLYPRSNDLPEPEGAVIAPFARLRT